MIGAEEWAAWAAVPAVGAEGAHISVAIVTAVIANAITGRVAPVRTLLVR